MLSLYYQNMVCFLLYWVRWVSFEFIILNQLTSLLEACSLLSIPINGENYSNILYDKRDRSQIYPITLLLIRK